MASYYFLGTLIDEVSFDHSPAIGASAFLELLKENLRRSDWRAIERVRLQIDIGNIQRHWQGFPLDPHGNLAHGELLEALENEAALPGYVQAFLEQHGDCEERRKHFGSLYSTFFREEIKAARAGLFGGASKAMAAYFMLERDCRLILTAFRAKQLGRDLIHELQYEDAEDDIVAQLLAHKDAEHYELPFNYQDLKETLGSYGHDPMALQKGLLHYRWHKLKELLAPAPFSFESLLIHLVALISIERWQKLDKDRGQQVVNRLFAVNPR